MKPCEFNERLTAYLDNELSPNDRSALESHLSHCEACRAELVLLRSAIASMASAASIEPSADLRRRVLTLIDRPPAGVAAWIRPLWRLKVLVPAGAFATAAALAVITLRPPPYERLRDIDVASNLELLENWELVSQIDLPAGTVAEDFEVVQHLDELGE